MSCFQLFLQSYAFCLNVYLPNVSFCLLFVADEMYFCSFVSFLCQYPNSILHIRYFCVTLQQEKN